MIATTKPRATRDGRYRLRRSESSVASVVIWLATTIRITNGRAPSFAVRDACGSVERHPVAVAVRLHRGDPGAEADVLQQSEVLGVAVEVARHLGVIGIER